jgi:hypothetical protein
MFHNLYHFSKGVIGPVVDQGLKGNPYAISVEGKNYKLSISFSTFTMYLFRVHSKPLCNSNEESSRFKCSTSIFYF